MLNESEVPKQSQSVFLVETAKINTNPLQPRREFDPVKLQELAASLRTYGILQPLVVFRVEREVPTGAVVEYELIAGERRLRAAKLAGIDQVPVVVRKEPPDRIKLELALIENVQREDLNPIERAEAYKKLLSEFGMTQKMLAERLGKSREVVANTVRFVGLPEYVKEAMRDSRLTEGHGRPLLMLSDRPEEQKKLFEEIIYKNATVRYAEQVARGIAVERRRKRDDLITDVQTKQMEDKLSDAFGTRVFIERKGTGGGGRIAIDFFSPEDLYGLLTRLGHDNFEKAPEHGQFEIHAAGISNENFVDTKPDVLAEENGNEAVQNGEIKEVDAKSVNPSHASEDDLKNFTV